jgi:hypothetical protein
MVKILFFLNEYAVLIFIALIIPFIIAFRKFRKSIHQKNEALFGLEKEISHRNRTAAISILWLIGLLALGELIVVLFVIPSYPDLNLISNPTQDIVSLPASTIPPEILATLMARTPDQTPTSTSSSCIPGLIMITTPKAGDQIRGKISLIGTANIPNFGFYKYEFTNSGTEDWVTIQAGREIVIDDLLGDWDTSEITPGDYLLRLVVLDNQGQVYPACEIQVRIVQP